MSTKPSNIKTVDWIPQKDLLGHARTRLFLSHVGHNSMYEAAYHGVPVIGFPMWSDQPENARQITQAGMGLWVDINTVSEDELHTCISRVLSEPRYVIDPKNMNLKCLMHLREHFIHESSSFFYVVVRSLLVGKPLKLVIKERYHTISIKIALHFCLTLLLKSTGHTKRQKTTNHPTQ